MKITKEAIELFYRMFFSCYMTGKSSSENNRKVIEDNLAKNSSLVFEEFCGNLQDWTTRKDAIIKVAKSLGKSSIDSEVIVRYFGGPQHTEVILDDLAREGIPTKKPFHRYTIFNHMLVPLEVKRIGTEENVIIGTYKNDGMQLEVRGVLFFEKDRDKIVVGKTVLCHFPMVIDTEPNANIVETLLDLQRRDAYFVDAVQSFGGMIDHTKFPNLSMLRKRMK